MPRATEIRRADEAIDSGPVLSRHTHPLQGASQTIAVWLTAKVGTMACAALFAALALISLPAALQSRNLIVIVGWVAQTFLQLVLLPVIIVGQSVQQAHSDARAEQSYALHVGANAKLDELLERV